MRKYWAQRIKISELRAELRNMNTDSAWDALRWLGGRKSGRYNFCELAWHAPTHIQAVIQAAALPLVNQENQELEAL